MSWTDDDVVTSSPVKSMAWSDDDIAPTVKDKLSVFKGPLGKYVNEPLVGIAETGAQILSSLPAQAVGGARGIISLLSGEGVDEATRKIRGTEQSITYQPQTDAGQALSRTVGDVAEWANKKIGVGAGFVGELVGGEKGRDIGESIGEVALPIAGTAVGGGQLLRATPKGRPIQDTFKAREATPAQVRESRMNAPKIEATQLAKDYDILVNPADANPTALNRTLSSMGGRKDITSRMANLNEGRWTPPLKRDIGMAADERITTESLGRMRSEAAAPIEQITSTVPQMVADTETLSTVRGLHRDPLIGERGAAAEANAVINDALEQLSRGSMDATEVFKNISQLRANNRRIHNSLSPTQADLAIADANIGVANALEQMIDRNLTRAGNEQLLNDYRAGRARMAKSYVLEDVTDFNTGRADPSKIAKMTSKDNALTGPFADIGKIAGNFPDIARFGAAGPELWQTHLSRTGLPGMIGAGIGTAIAPGVGTGIGATVGAGVGELAGAAAARYLRSGRGQHGAQPADFRPARERLGYGDVPPEPPPLALAPEGPLPTTRQNVEPAVRPTMELVEADAQSAALRGQPARGPDITGPMPRAANVRQALPPQPAQTRLGSQDYPAQAPDPRRAAMLQQQPTPGAAAGPVEFTPGGGLDMPMPIEKAANIPMNIQKELAKYQKQFSEAMTIEEQLVAKQNIDAIQSLMRQEGFTGNTQKLYGEGFGYPVQKTFDPRSEALRNGSR